jgi:hypothetical protein
MENYKVSLKKNLFLAIGGLALYVAANFVFYFLAAAQTQSHVSEFLRGFHSGGVGAGLAFLTILVVRYISALGNEEKLKKMYIAQTDERKKMIIRQAGSLCAAVSIFSLALATLVAGYFNTTVFLTLLCAELFITLVFVSLKLYYKNKY